MIIEELKYSRNDGTYVGVVNGFPYHITKEDPLFDQASQIAFEVGTPPLEPEIVLSAPVQEKPTLEQLKAQLDDITRKINSYSE